MASSTSHLCDGRFDFRLSLSREARAVRTLGICAQMFHCNSLLLMAPDRDQYRTPVHNRGSMRSGRSHFNWCIDRGRPSRDIAGVRQISHLLEIITLA